MKLQAAVIRKRALKPTSGKGNTFVPLVRGPPKTYKESKLPLRTRFRNLTHVITLDHVDEGWLASRHGRQFNNRKFILDSLNEGPADLGKGKGKARADPEDDEDADDAAMVDVEEEEEEDDS